METPSSFEERCHAYFDGSLSLDEQASLLAQIRSNPKAQLIFDQYQQLHSLIKHFGEEEPSANLESRVIQAIAKAENPQKVVAIGSRQKKAWLPLQAVAAVLIVAVAGVTVMLKPWETNSDRNLAPNVPQFQQQLTSHPLSEQQGASAQEDESFSYPERVAANASLENDATLSDASIEQSLEEAWFGVESMNQEVALLDEVDIWPQ